MKILKLDQNLTVSNIDTILFFKDYEKCNNDKKMDLGDQVEVIMNSLLLIFERHTSQCMAKPTK